MITPFLASNAVTTLSSHMADAKINIVLVAPEIPHNTGAIGRLCVGLEARLHLVRPLGFSLDDRYVKRCGMDYWKHVQLEVHDDWDTFLAAEKPESMAFLSTKGEKDLYECSFTENTYIVFGNESSGLPKGFYNRYHGDLYQIPMLGPHARAINLANAVSIAAYEMYRQLL
jgi:tRNA (cytidine/uridine-2'-O-)-methyltransferase